MENVNVYWEDIPVGKGNAISYEVLCGLWACDTRTARARLHELSQYDNGDNYILIRSGGCNRQKRKEKAK